MTKYCFFVLSMITILFNTGYSGSASSKQSQSCNYLHPRMREAFHRQISKEQYSSNLYLSFATYFADLGLDGCEQFFRASAADEQQHALLFFNHLVDRGEKFQMGAVPASGHIPTSVLDAFTALLDNEMEVTASIHNLYTIALEEKDYASQAFLYPFLLLQVEEEKQAQDLLQLLESGSNDPAFILVFDNKVGESAEND